MTSPTPHSAFSQFFPKFFYQLLVRSLATKLLESSQYWETAAKRCVHWNASNQNKITDRFTTSDTVCVRNLDKTRSVRRTLVLFIYLLASATLPLFIYSFWRWPPRKMMPNSISILSGCASLFFPFPLWETKRVYLLRIRTLCDTLPFAFRYCLMVKHSPYVWSLPRLRKRCCVFSGSEYPKSKWAIQEPFTQKPSHNHPSWSAEIALLSYLHLLWRLRQRFLIPFLMGFFILNCHVFFFIIIFISNPSYHILLILSLLFSSFMSSDSFLHFFSFLFT